MVGTPLTDSSQRHHTLKMLVAYDGAPFHGFALNPGVRTVAGDLIAAIVRISRTDDVELTCAGRTDKGVHAWGQVVTVAVANTERLTDLVRLQRSLNSMLAPNIAIRRVTWAEPGFDARHTATWRRYRYTVNTSEVHDPFTGHLEWQIGNPLSIDAMNDAAQHLIGSHDFSSFCRRPVVPEGKLPVSLVREVYGARWVALDSSRMRFEIVASSFCHQMVRSTVGTLVDVGKGRRSADELPRILERRDRSGASPIAPPEGLCLWEVGYGGDPLAGSI